MLNLHASCSATSTDHIAAFDGYLALDICPVSFFFLVIFKAL